MTTEPIPPRRMLRTSAFLVLGKDRNGHVKIRRTTQSEPQLERGERMIRLALELDDAMWTPMPTPGLTIQIHAPIYPDAVVLASEWPQTPITDRPEDTDDRSDTIPDDHSDVSGF